MAIVNHFSLIIRNFDLIIYDSYKIIDMKRTVFAAITLLLAIAVQAQRRVNNRMYNPDPAPVVSGDRLYVFTGHDLDTATYALDGSWYRIEYG